MATGWVGDKVAFQQFSDPVTGPLAVSPDPTAPTMTLGGSGLQIDPATAWLFDYQEALERGMAITVPLTETAAIAADGVTTLVVIGVDEAQRPLDAAAELQALFEQHSQSAGLAFVPQGTPTNNTETVASGYRRVEAELADLEARELDVYVPDADDNATRLASALGLADAELFGRLAHGSDREHQTARDMRIALFETVFGTFARQVLATHDTDSSVLGPGLGDLTVDALRSWFVTWLTGGAPVPSVRIGDQPYGVLPVMTRADVDHSTLTKQRIASFIDVLIEEWRHARSSVAVLDHNATDALQDNPAVDDAEARELVTTVLANNPHPRRLAVRAANDWSDQPRPIPSSQAALPRGRRQPRRWRLDDLGGSDGGNPGPDLPELMLIPVGSGGSTTTPSTGSTRSSRRISRSATTPCSKRSSRRGWTSTSTFRPALSADRRPGAPPGRTSSSCRERRPKPTSAGSSSRSRSGRRSQRRSATHSRANNGRPQRLPRRWTRSPTT